MKKVEEKQDVLAGFDLIEKLALLRDEFLKASSFQRMALAERIAEVSLNALIQMAGRQRLLERELKTIKAGVQHAAG